MITFHGLGEHGRLGNQLWQIASTVGIAHGLDEPVALDPDWIYRPYFSLPDEWFADNWMDKTEASSYALHLPERWRKYMQDPSIFADVADTIRAAFAPSARAWAVLGHDGMGQADIAVHVRRTDYEGRDGYLDMLPLDYYLYAAGKVLSRPDPFLCCDVYGDDPAWAEENLPSWWNWCAFPGAPENPEPTDWLDLFRMARYHRVITANSSYSWWAAFLAGPEAIVVAPDPWFGPKIDVPSPALPEWIKVPA